MIFPTPKGTRDFLPEEMRELRQLMAAMMGVFEQYQYGEIATPTLEYDTVLQIGRCSQRETESAYRLFDEQGELLTLRTDMTVPIARVAATRFRDAQPPLRFFYFAPCYRGVRARRGQAREFMQAGIELVGAPEPVSVVEVLEVLCAALDAIGLVGYRIGLGHAALYPALMATMGVPIETRDQLLGFLERRDLVGLERVVESVDLPHGVGELLIRMSATRGGVEVLTRDFQGLLPPELEQTVQQLRAVAKKLPQAVSERIIFDLGLVRELGYYTGCVFEVYDPAFGKPLGGGGQYDDLLRSFGSDLPAVGFGLNIERLHIALTGEERTA